MAGPFFVRSTTGADTNDGLSWATALATLGAAVALCSTAGGDMIYVSMSHSETSATTLNIALSNTSQTSIKIVCVDDTGDPAVPTIKATGALITNTATSGTNYLNFSSYMYGIHIVTDSALYFGSGNTPTLIADYCTFESDSNILIGGNYAPSLARLNHTNIRVGNASSSKAANLECGGRFEWNGGALLANTNVYNGLIYNGSGAGLMDIELHGVDLSLGRAYAAGQSFTIIRDFYNIGRIARIYNCKMPSTTDWAWGWAVVVATGSGARGYGRLEVYGCDSGDGYYRLWIADLFGQITEETVLLRSGGATDGVTPISWKMVTGEIPVVYPVNSLVSPVMDVYCTTPGTAMTVDVEILHDSTTALNNDDVWLEAIYKSDTASTITSVIDNSRDVLGAPTAQPASTATWATTGLANPNTQKLSLTFTPQTVGIVELRVRLAKPSYTIYIDPEPVVS
jgi:hypothetical protein